MSGWPVTGQSDENSGQSRWIQNRRPGRQLGKVSSFASSGEASAVPALVAVVDDEAGALVYGLRIPARTAVVFRPVRPADVRPADVRPRGLDE